MSVIRGTVAAVSRSEVYSFSKPAKDEIVLVAGIGVEGDVHAGVRVKHRGRVRADPTQPNLRQVHLIHEELLADVAEKGHVVAPGELGENVTTRGIDLLSLPRGTIVRFGYPVAPSRAGGGLEPEVNRGVAPAGTGGPEAVAGVLAVAAAAELDGPTAAASVAIRAAVDRDSGDDMRPAVILAGLRNPCAQINSFQSGLLNEMVGHDGEGNVVRRAGVMAVVLRGGAVRPGDPVIAELPPSPHGALERV